MVQYTGSFVLWGCCHKDNTVCVAQKHHSPGGWKSEIEGPLSAEDLLASFVDSVFPLGPHVGEGGARGLLGSLIRALTP